MNLIRTSLLSLVSTSVKMVAGLVVSKTVALIAGPPGLAVVGQFQNFVQIALTAAKGGMDTGVTKYTAEFGGDLERQRTFLSTAAALGALTCLAVAAVLLLAAPALARYFLQTAAYAPVIRLLGVTIALFVLNSFILAIINGLHEIRTYVAINIAQSLLTLIITVALTSWLGLIGALVALAVNQSLVLVVVLWAVRGHALIRWANFRRGIDRADAVRLVKFSAMTIVSAIAAPVTAIAVRGQVMTVLGADAAGWWQAMWFVASVYLTAVTTSLSVYYLPKLSATVDPAALRAELRGGFVIVMPIVMVSALTLYLARDLVVRLLFTEAFLPMRGLFGWMLLGDVVKMASWLLSYLMLAKAMTRAFLVTEILFSALFVGLASAAIRRYGLDGAAYAYTATYVLYFGAVAMVTRRIWLPERR
ncbi:O-antigen translocase [Sphingomonas sp. BK345]|uniref:O-antigen translocase n=1 Tax=Sphingomonas sp. BK345 TaxID=2586980 RepID=UPI00161A2E03|nr:O-antigen translocase [Sphingomonas sp. BK345]MBB3475881.1 PST family polysaccharide transporter [Sphingomonas sp. BK345]